MNSELYLHHQEHVLHRRAIDMCQSSRVPKLIISKVPEELRLVYIKL